MELKRCCIHSITNKPWKLEQAVDKYAEAGIGGISVWQSSLEGIGAKKAADHIKASGLEVVSYVRGGFFAHPGGEERKKAIENNKRQLEEAAELGAPLIVLVCGASPAQSLEVSRQQIRDGIEALLPMAEELNIRLAIEPLHPMYAADRSAINTLGQANDMAEAIGSGFAGVAVDVYHLWWDGDLRKEILRCGTNGHLFAYHVCDWKVNTLDMLNDRGLMGEGCIDLKSIRSWVEEAGFHGYHEVEIFSDIYWQTDQDVYLKKITTAFTEKC